jgi:hypothetical protein
MYVVSFMPSGSKTRAFMNLSIVVPEATSTMRERTSKPAAAL